MVFTRLISTSLAISGLTGALATPVEANALSPDAPKELTTVPSELSGDDRRRLNYEDGELAVSYDLTNAQKQMFVDRHNHWRNRAALGELNTGKKAKQMAKMYWDEELAQHAKEFSRKCIWEHSMFVGWRQVDYGYGENLYATSGTTWDEGMIQRSMDNWAWEHEYYDHNTLSCSREPCGHYTAMVWEHTTRVGCAVAKCDSISEISWANGGHYIICQYYRGGNYRGQAPYEYSLTTGNGCSDAPYGGSTGMDSQWPGLCNNQNDICTETNRCSAAQTCSSLAPLNGEDAQYQCSAPECTFEEFPGYQVDDAWDSVNGMTSETGGWKYLQNRAQCEEWCYLNKDASPSCLGCTQQSNQAASLWFPVKNADQSVRSARAHSSGSEMILLVLDCSTPGVAPTPRPTSPSGPTPTAPPATDPTSPPASNPTSPPASDPTSPPATDEPTDEPTEEPTNEPVDDYTCTTVTYKDVEMADPCGGDQFLTTENGGWALCRDTPDECIEWCKANRYTGPCLGVSSDDRNPGFFFPVKKIDVARRSDRAGAILITMECTPTGNPTDPPATPTAEPTDEGREPTSPPATDEPTEEPTEEPTFEPTEETPTEEPTFEPTEEAPAPTEEPTFEPTEEAPEPTEEPTEEPTVEDPTEPTAEPTDDPAGDYTCTTVTYNDVEMADPCGGDQYLTTENGGWAMCRGTPDDCVEWCKANRYTGPCLGVSSDDRNPGFFFPVKKIDVARRSDRAGAILITMECTASTPPTPVTPAPTSPVTPAPTAPVTPAPTSLPNGDGAKFDIGSCDHLELTEGGNCVATTVYGNNHDCEITVLGDFDLEVRDWEVEAHHQCSYDYLKLPSGEKFCTNSPQGESVSNGDKLEWSTDHSVTKDGWEICAGSRRRQDGETEAVLRRLQK